MSVCPVRAGRNGAPRVSPGSIRSELEKVLSSGRFAASERQRRFLQFVVVESLDGRGAGIKESVVAVEVFGRDSSFDPRTDSVVRSEARNLRARLNEYYLGEGSQDPVVIELPKGSYVPVFRAVPAAAAGPDRSVRPVALAAALAVAVCGLGWWFFALRPPRPGTGNLRSIAVLPFLNLGGSAASDYIADGFVEDLTTEFAKLPELRVVARTSAFQYRGKNQDIRKIGRELSAGAVLEGGYREEAGRVKVTVQLISSESGYHLWSESYDRESAGAQDVEVEILNGVVAALGVPHRDRAPSQHTPPPESREAYWRGRYLKANNWEHAGAESIPYFEKAVATDPQLAEAWAALAATHANMAFQLEGSQEDEIAKGRKAAQRALELDQTIAETQLALAVIAYSYDLDWPAAERAFRRALELNPSYAAGHRGFAMGLMSRGRFVEAIEHLKAAEQLDPISILTTNNMATTLYCARRYGEAIRVARRHLEMDPHFHPAALAIGMCEVEMGQLAAGISELEKVRAETGGGNLAILGSLGNAYARAGRTADAASVLKELETVPNGRAGVALAMVHTGRGEKKQAIELLRQAADAHVTDAIFIGVNPVFDPLRSDPDFQALCARLSLRQHTPPLAVYN